MHCSTGRLHRLHSLHSSRRLRRLPLLIVAALLCLLAPTPPSALAALAAPGDNGDIKIHAVGTSFVDNRNQPHVCVFYLDAFNFDAHQHVSWTIAQQPPTGHAQVSSGTLILDASGAGRSADMSLPAGHYKLTWTFAGEKGRAKFKVFWSDCSGVPSPSPSPSHSASSSPSASASASSSSSPSSSSTPSSSSCPVCSPSPSSSASPSGSKSGSAGPGGKHVGPGGPGLAQTGADTAPWLLAAAVLAAAGIGFVGFARRAARRH